MERHEAAKWLCRYSLRKYREDIETYRGREEEFRALFKPYEVISGEGNCLLNTGIDEMWDLICGDSVTAKITSTWLSTGTTCQRTS